MIKTERMEINATRHCNNGCAACNHGSPWAAPYFMQPETLRRDLAALKPILHTNFLCLQGGEPLLHKGIGDLLEVMRQSGLANTYGILTNGLLLHRMSDEFYRQIGSMKIGDNPFELRVTVYPNLDRALLDHPAAKAKEHGFKFVVNPKTEFWKIFKEHPDGGKQIWSTCYARECHTMHEGWFITARFPASFPNSSLAGRNTLTASPWPESQRARWPRSWRKSNHSKPARSAPAGLALQSPGTNQKRMRTG